MSSLKTYILKTAAITGGKADQILTSKDPSIHDIRGKRKRHALMGAALGAALGGGYAAFQNKDPREVATYALAGGGIGAGGGYLQNKTRSLVRQAKALNDLEADEYTNFHYMDNRERGFSHHKSLYDAVRRANIFWPDKTDFTVEDPNTGVKYMVPVERV